MCISLYNIYFRETYIIYYQAIGAQWLYVECMKIHKHLHNFKGTDTNVISNVYHLYQILVRILLLRY